MINVRSAAPLVSGVALAAVVGAGATAELGAMRISEEIDALEVMGVDSLNFLCSTKMLAAWLVLPFLYLTGVASGFLGSYIAVVHQLGHGIGEWHDLGHVVAR